MQRRTLAILTLAAPLLFGSLAAHADRGGDGYRGGPALHPHGSYRDYSYRGRHRGWDRHPGARARYGDHRHPQIHHRRKHRNNEGAYLIGGLIAGSLLTHVLTQPAREPAYYATSTRVYREPPVREVVSVRQTAPVTPGRHLVRDIDGNCFERLLDIDGNEILTELPAAECRW